MRIPYIVAELSSSHNGQLDQAITLIACAKEFGADAVKFQVYDPNEMVLGNYLIPDGPWAGRELRELYVKGRTPLRWLPELTTFVGELGLDWFASIFSQTDVDCLEKLDCPKYKIASCEIVDLELISYAAATGKPLVISTGMASKDEIFEAYEAARVHLDPDKIWLLACSAEYPATQPMEAKVRWLIEHFPSRVGLSDHSVGPGSASAAVFAGATMIEKHIKAWNDVECADAGFASEPAEFLAMVNQCRKVWDAMRLAEQADFGPTREEASTFALRRSLWLNKPLSMGHILTAADISTARPNLGAHPHLRDSFVGAVLITETSGPTPLTEALVQWPHAADHFL